MQTLSEVKLFDYLKYLETEDVIGADTAIVRSYYSLQIEKNKSSYDKEYLSFEDASPKEKRRIANKILAKYEYFHNPKKKLPKLNQMIFCAEIRQHHIDRGFSVFRGYSAILMPVCRDINYPNIWQMLPISLLERDFDRIINHFHKLNKNDQEKIKEDLKIIFPNTALEAHGIGYNFYVDESRLLRDIKRHKNFLQDIYVFSNRKRKSRTIKSNQLAKQIDKSMAVYKEKQKRPKKSLKKIGEELKFKGKSPEELQKMDQIERIGYDADKDIQLDKLRKTSSDDYIYAKESIENVTNFPPSPIEPKSKS